MKDHDARARLNGLVIVYMSTRVIKHNANRNEGYPSYDHDLKHDTSSIDLYWLGLRTNFYLNMSIMLAPLGSTL